MAELKPCPFCGDNQQLNYVELSNGLHYIECARCGAAPHRLGAWNRETAVKYWNSVNRWIPVEDALPEKDKSYITYAETTKYCNHNEIPEELRINILYFNGEEWYDEECIYYNVTHYMPLPEPPKEDET